MAANYELKLIDGRKVTWQGKDGQDACRRYIDAHPGATIVAVRAAERVGVFVGLLPIKEPGQP